jgi:hypothetical protein
MNSNDSKLAELFEATPASVIEWNGLQVYVMFEIGPIDPGTVIRVEFLRHSTRHPQAMVVKTIGAQLQLGDRRSQTWRLWPEEPPRRRELTLVPDGGGPISLRFWNGYEDSHGTFRAWVGNAGMLVTEIDDNVFRADCSDGFDEAVFEDLVAQFDLKR